MYGVKYISHISNPPSALKNVYVNAYICVSMCSNRHTQDKLLHRNGKNKGQKSTKYPRKYTSVCR